ncbi:MAG: PKD domain-containing protein [Lacipirellulaceae bacterium]
MPSFSGRKKPTRKNQSKRAKRRAVNARNGLRLETLESRILLTSDPVLSFTAPGPIDEGSSVSVGFSFSDLVESSGTSSVGLDPADFTANSTANGLFDPATDVVIDTDALTISGGFTGSGVIQTADAGFGSYEIAVFAFDDFELDAGINLRATGSRPLALLSQLDVDISGNIDVSAESFVNTNLTQATIPGAGGGMGGDAQGNGLGGRDGYAAAGAPLTSVGELGTGGPLGGASGSGGGSHGNGQAGSAFGSGRGSGGTGFLDVVNSIQGGSGGSAAGVNTTATAIGFGGAGGGGVEVGAVNSIVISTTGQILADAASGYPGFNGGTGGGGGAGGGILVHATNITQDGTLSADGGDGGSGIQVGGGGGGGEIVLAYSASGTFSGTGTESVAAGSGNVFANPTATDGSVSTITFSGTPIIENYSYTINWGDGSATETGSDTGGEIAVTPGSPGGPDTMGSFNGTHSYVDDGVFTVEVIVTDTGGGSVTELFDVTVNNVAPNNLVLNATPVIDENGVATLDVSFDDPGVLDAHEVVVDWGDGNTDTVNLTVGDRTTQLTHQYLDDAPTGTASDSFTINVTVTDDDLASGSGTANVTVNNVAPTNLVLTATPTIDENGVATLDVSFDDVGTLDTHDVTIDWGDGTVESVALTLGDRSGSFTHQYLDDDPTGTASDAFTINVTVADDDLGSGSETASVTVNNLAPEITSLTTSSPAIGGAEQGETVTLSADFTDVGTLDTHTAVIDWGDGTTTVGVVDQNTGTITGDHVYANGGFYDVTLTLTDDDTGEAVETTATVIAGVGLNDGVLQFVGTNGDDRVKAFHTYNCDIKVKYRLDGGAVQSEVFDPADVDRIVYYLGDGNDVGFVSSWIDLDATMFGDGGHDLLLGGHGNDALIGGDGDDTLVGRSGRDLLIGGDGSDLIVGQGGSDILISGTTSFDSDLSAIDSIMAEWTSSHDYDTRVANLTQQGLNPEAVDRLNGDIFLVADLTVFDDDDTDFLIGGRGKDLYFANLEGGTEDYVFGLRNSEFVEELDIV